MSFCNIVDRVDNTLTTFKTIGRIKDIVSEFLRYFHRKSVRNSRQKYIFSMR